jgi:hypothetical protein
MIIIISKVYLPDFPKIIVSGTLRISGCIWTFTNSTNKNQEHISVSSTGKVVIDSLSISSYSIIQYKFIISTPHSSSDSELITCLNLTFKGITSSDIVNNENYHFFFTKGNSSLKDSV